MDKLEYETDWTVDYPTLDLRFVLNATGSRVLQQAFRVQTAYTSTVEWRDVPLVTPSLTDLA